MTFKFTPDDRSRLIRITMSGISEHKERFENNPYLKDIEIDKYIVSITNNLVDAIEAQNADFEGLDPQIDEEELASVVSSIASQYPRFTDYELSKFIEHLYSIKNGRLGLTQEAQALLNDRWPFTSIFVRCFEEYKTGRFESIEDSVEEVVDQILSVKNVTNLISADEIEEILGYYRSGDFKACYFFAGSYSERILAQIRGEDRVNEFKGKTKNLYQSLKNTTREPLLMGFFKSVEKHWGNASISHSPIPTRHSIAHGIRSERNVSRRDALQMILILQAVPYWMSNAMEIKAIEL